MEEKKNRNEDKKVKRVRTLLRVSSKQQLHDDDIPIQRAETVEYIEKQPDWELDKEYIEKAVSAYKNGVEDREVLQQIIKDAQNREFDILLAYMSDRIGRKEEYILYISELNRLGVEVWTVKEGRLKNEEHIDKLLNYIRFWQNEGESKKTSDRVRDSQAKLVKTGKFLGGKAPYGYHFIDSGMVSTHGRMLKKLVISEKEAAVVRKIYSLYIHKGYGYEKIAKELNREGIPAMTTDKWKNGTVCSILKNPVYMGYFAIHRREKGKNFRRLDRTEWIMSEVQNKDIVIVSQSDWEKAQEIRESRKDRLEESRQKSVSMYEKQYNAPFNPRGKLALLGIAYCGYCGKRLKSTGYGNHWTTKDGTEKVSCVGRYGCPERCEERSYYSQDFLEDTVFKVVRDYLGRLKEVNIAEELQKMKDQQNASYVKAEREITREISKVMENIRTMESKIPEAIRGEYYFSAETLSRQISEAEERLKELKQDMKKLENKIGQTEITYGDLEKFTSIAPNWEQVFNEADIPTKRMLLSSLIERIEVKNNDISIKFRIRLDDFIGASESSGGSGKPAPLKNKEILETIGSPTIPYIPCSE